MPLPLSSKLPPPDVILKLTAVKDGPSMSAAFASNSACVIILEVSSAKVLKIILPLLVGASFAFITVTAIA